MCLTSLLKIPIKSQGLDLQEIIFVVLGDPTRPAEGDGCADQTDNICFLGDPTRPAEGDSCADQTDNICYPRLPYKTSRG